MAKDTNKEFTTNLKASFDHINTIKRLYPLYHKLFRLFEPQENELILDYGCGPGNDVLGFSLFSKTKKIIACDISDKAISQAIERLNMHNITITGDVTDDNGVTFLKMNEQTNKINMLDNSVDYIQSSGVIHHTSNPTAILKEMFRILKKNSIARFMMYHRNSLYIRLTLVLELIKNKKNMDVYDYFENTGRADSGAPIAFLSDNHDFTLMGKEIGFDAKFINAAFSIADLRSILDIPYALSLSNFPEHHKEFLKNITYETVNTVTIDNYNFNLDIDRLYELEISINNYDMIPLKYTFKGLTNKGYYTKATDFVLQINTEAIIFKVKLYSFKSNINIIEKK